MMVTMTHDAAVSEPVEVKAKVRFWLPLLSLWRREMVRFLRQKHRVASALFTPFLFWVFLGFGFNHSFTHRGLSDSPAVNEVATTSETATTSIGYAVYFYPGMLGFMLLSTAVFSTITVIEDRREGFLQGVLTAPVNRLAIVLGKVMGGATIATAQGVILLLLWPMVVGGSTITGIGGDVAGVAAYLNWLPHMLAAAGALAVLATGLTALGLCLAWPMDSTSGFHAVMMILLMPMWFLSGAVFPISGAPGWLATIMLLNPLTYGQAALTGLLTGRDDLVGIPMSATTALGVTLVITLGLLLLAAKWVSKPRKDGLA